MFHSYASNAYIDSNQGNGVFGFVQKNQKKSDYHLYIPSIKIISSLDEIVLTQENTLIVADQTRSVEPTTYHGLAHIYIYMHASGGKTIPIYICDNHNHALYFRYMYMKHSHNLDDIYISHIDQHSDLLTNQNSTQLAQAHNNNNVTEEFLYNFVHKKCHVGNFIDPFLQTFQETYFQWIKSEYQLLHLDERDRSPTSSHIVDIDLDFWAPEMSLDKKDLSIIHAKRMINSGDIVTIATSPYYLNQQLALDLLRELFK